MNAKLGYNNLRDNTAMNKLSRRSFLRIAATGATGALLAACTLPATPQAGGGQEASGAAERTVVNVFESCWDAPHIEAGKELYEGFEAEHPNIDVNASWAAPDGDWATELLAKV